MLYNSFYCPHGSAPHVLSPHEVVVIVIDSLPVVPVPATPVSVNSIVGVSVPMLPVASTPVTLTSTVVKLCPQAPPPHVPTPHVGLSNSIDIVPVSYTHLTLPTKRIV